MTGRVLEKLVEVHRITEWRDGCVWKTVYVEDRWVEIDSHPTPPEQYVPFSTEKEMERVALGLSSFRSRRVS